MKRFLPILATLALVLLGAHALRRGDLGLAAAHAILAGLSWTRQGWVRLVCIAALAWGAHVWVDTAIGFINVRKAIGMEWHRLAYIMSGVLAFNILAMVSLLIPAAVERYELNTDKAWPRAVAFVLTVIGLTIAREKVIFYVLLADRFLPGWGSLEVAGLGFYASWIVGLMLDVRMAPKVRARIWGLFSLVFFLQLCLGLAGVERMLMTGALHIPVPALIAAGPIFRGGGLFMAILFASTILLVGPAWCSHLCYIGAWDDQLSRMGARPAPNEALSRWMMTGRLVTLILVVGCAILFNALGVSAFTAGVAAVIFGLIGVGIMVFVSRKVGHMTHCTAFCPIGLLSNVLGRINPWRVRINDNCTQCQACYTKCRYNALNDLRLDKGSPGITCTLCGDCLSACRHNAMEYTFPGLSAETARAAFIVMVVSLHAIFMGVARM